MASKDESLLDDFCDQNPEVFLPEKWKDNYSPLHLAAEIGFSEAALKFVIRSNMGGIRDKEGLAPYQRAEAAGHTELAESLKQFAHPGQSEYLPENDIGPE